MADFGALHVALSGLRAAQVAMDTASHNVSNANTVGYTRQRVDLASRLPRVTTVGQVGMGVEVTDIARIRDAFLDARYRASSATSSELDSRVGFLNRAELLFAEPDQGVSTELDQLFDSFEEWSLDPTDRASRTSVLQHLDSLASRVNEVARSLQTLSADAADSVRSGLSEANGLIQQIADLNKSILDANALGGVSNDLMDKRDLMIDRLTQLTGATATVEGNGSIRVAIGGIALVSGAEARPLTFDASTGKILHPAGVEVTVGGEVRGAQLAMTQDIPNLASKLDAFAIDLANALNTVHTGGYNASGAGGPLLSYGAGAPALTLAVAITDPDQLATSATGGSPFPVYDASIPQALADLRNSPVALSGSASLGDSMSAIVAGLGRDTAATQTAADTQKGLADAADRARMGTHGVSVDEEMVSLMEYQRMYEAAARVITAVDQSLDTLINRTGMVGR